MWHTVTAEQLQHNIYPTSMVCFRYIIVNTLHNGGGGDDDDDDDDNNNNNIINNNNNNIERVSTRVCRLTAGE